MSFKKWIDAVQDELDGDEDMIVAYHDLLHELYMKNWDVSDAADYIGGLS